MNDTVGAGAAVRRQPTPLRKAQKELTRSRIREAAKSLFFETHYDTTTMDQIASAAGLQRSTVYLHYVDKAEILSDIVAEYAPLAREINSKLPGPVPSKAQISRWIDEVMEFSIKEKISLTVLQEFGRYAPGAPSIRVVVTAILSGLAENVTAFRTAGRKGKKYTIMRARGELLIHQLTMTCNYAIYGDDPVYCAALKEAVADAFLAFVKDAE